MNFLQAPAMNLKLSNLGLCYKIKNSHIFNCIDLEMLWRDY